MPVFCLARLLDYGVYGVEADDLTLGVFACRLIAILHEEVK